MKTSALLTFALLAAAPSAFAATTPRKSAQIKTVTIAQLKQEAQALVETLANAGDCEFKIQDQRDGITLSLRDSHNVSAYLDVKTENEITLEDEAIDVGDSSSLLFRVTGQGAVRLIHADDAFERAELTDRDGRVLSCELDM